jgi:hypothetical protein
MAGFGGGCSERTTRTDADVRQQRADTQAAMSLAPS